MSPSDIIAHYGMTEHPEGGAFVRVFTSKIELAVSDTAAHVPVTGLLAS